MVSTQLFLSGSKMDVINQLRKYPKSYPFVSTALKTGSKSWCEFGANLVQHLMRQDEKYQTICDYALTISHDMDVINDIKLCETPMQKLQEIIFQKKMFFIKEKHLF